jgi:superfamily II DNA or RNA helicase
LTGKTRIVLEFVREFWRRRGRCSVLVVVPRRVLAYNPWRKKNGGHVLS